MTATKPPPFITYLDSRSNECIASDMYTGIVPQKASYVMVAGKKYIVNQVETTLVTDMVAKNQYVSAITVWLELIELPKPGTMYPL